MKTKNMALLLLSATMLAGCGKVNEVPANNSEALGVIKKNADAVVDGDSISADAKISGWMGSRRIRNGIPRPVR